MFEKRDINFGRQGGVKFPKMCVTTYYVSMAFDCVRGVKAFIYRFSVFLAPVKQSVSQSQPPRADYKVEVVCGESQRGVAVCASCFSVFYPGSTAASGLACYQNTKHQWKPESVVGRLLKAFHWS